MVESERGKAKRACRAAAYARLLAGLGGLAALALGFVASGAGAAQVQSPAPTSRKCRQVDYAGHVPGLGGPRRFLNLRIERCGKEAGIDLAAPCAEFTGGPLPVDRGFFSYKYTTSNGYGASVQAALTASKAQGVIKTWGRQKRCDKSNVHFSIQRS